MKALLFIILFALTGFAMYYFYNNYHKPALAQCPIGSRYVRSSEGGGLVDTDPSDPWGSCVSQSQIDSANNP